MTEQSRAERGQRLRAPFALLNPFSSSTPFILKKIWMHPCKGNARQR